MDIKKILIGLILIIMVMPIVLAENKLSISDLDVEVDGRWSRDLTDGETITRDAAPGDDVSFKIKFRNNYTDDENLRIEDIVAVVTIEDIDDGESLEEESKEFDIREDDDDTVTIDFQIPIEVEEDTYTVTIEADGDDENGTSHSVSWTIYLNVEKERDELRYYRQTLLPSTITCGGTTSLTIGIINTGSDDQEEVELKIIGTGLEYENMVTIDSIDADPFDDSCKYSKSFTIPIDKDVSPGVYPITFITTYDNGRETLEDSVELTVLECQKEEKPAEDTTDNTDSGSSTNSDTTTKDTSSTDDEVDVIITPTTPVQPPITTPTTQTEEKSFFESGWFIGLFIGAQLLIIIIVLVLVVMFLNKKNN